MAIKEFDGQLDEEIQQPSIKEFTGKLDDELPEQPKEATVGGEAVKSFKQMGSTYQTLLGTITGDTEAATRAASKRQEELTKEYGQTRGLKEATEAYDRDGVLAAGAEVASQVPQALAGQTANLTTMAAGSKAGAIAGTAVMPGIGTTIGAALGAIATQIVPFYEQNLISQLRAQEERGEPIDLNRAKAAAYATLQSSAEVGGTVLAFGKKLIGSIIGSKPATEATEALVKAARQSLLAASGKGAVRATSAELPVEVSQNILQRYQAGESLTNDDALEDYKNTIYGTILVAGPLGATAGPVNRMQAQGELNRRELSKLQTEQGTGELADAGVESKLPPETPEQADEIEQRIAALESTSADLVAPIKEDDVDETNVIAGATPPDQSYVPGTPPVTAPPAPAAVTTPAPTIQGDQDATGQPIAGGVGVSPEVSGQPGGVPAGGVGGVDGTGVDIAGDTGASTQAGTTGEPSTLTAETPPAIETPIVETPPAIETPIIEAPAPAATAPAPIKTATDTGMEVTTEQKIAKPIKYVAGYTPTAEPSVSNFLNQNSVYGQEAPLTVDRGIRMAAADQAFDSFDSAQGKVLNRLKVLANAKNKQEGVEGKYSFERPFEFMTEGELVNLYKENAGSKKTFVEGGKARLDAAKNRVAFIESLTPEQRAKFDADLEEMLNRTVVAEASGRREATESDQRKQREKQEKRVGKQQAKAVADVQEQVAEANKTDEQIAAEELAEAETFAKQQEVETEQAAVKEATAEAKEKKVSTRDKRIQSAIADGGDIKNILEEIGKDKETAVGMMARRLTSIFKYLGINDPTAKRVSFGKVPDGNDGMFMPDKNRIFIKGENGQYTGERNLGEVVLHEITHYYIDHVIDNQKQYLDSLPAEERPAVKAALNRLNQNFKVAKTALGGQFNIPTIKEFIAEAFSNPRFQQALLNLDKSGKGYKPTTKDNMFVQFVKNVLGALGIDVSEKGALFGQTLEDVVQIFSVPGNGLYGRSTSYSAAAPAATPAKAAKAPKKPIQMGPSKPASLYEDDLKYSVDSLKPKSLTKRLTDTFTPSNLITKFQNTKHSVKVLENKAGLAGLINDDGPNQNNVYTEATLSAERASMNYKRVILEPVKRLESTFNQLVKATNSTVDKTIAMLGKIAVAQHEPERRTVKFIKSAPLRPQMADVRKQIFELLESPVKLTDAQTARLRKKLDSIMFELDQNGNVKTGPDGYPVVNKTNVTPLGFSPTDLKTVDVGHPDYNVIDMDGASVKNIMDEYSKHPQRALIENLFGAVRDIEAGTRQLNSVSNYWSNPVSNIVGFYGWKNYVPMKARLEKDAFFDPSHRGRELQDAQSSFEGSDRTPDNPILQVMSDAARAASRSGRGNYTLAIKNAVDQKLIEGKTVKKIQFADRDKDLPESKKKNTIFHYNADGTVDVIEIAKPEMLESLRRTYKDSNPLVDIMNMTTGFIGKMHTRWNYAFAPMNFVRDTLTNAFVMGADFGPMDTARMLGKVASQVGARGGLFKAAKVANMYENGDIKGMQAYAAKDAFVKQLVEYLDTGGAVSYTAGLSLKDKLQQLNRELGRGKIIKTHEQFEKFVDVWNNMFEFSSRAAAYGVVKNRMMKNGLTESQARTRATAYVKNLANFEQVGEHGKLMGGLFMFFRPAATGAVRAIESVLPAFQSLDSAKKQLPPAILNNPTALARFEQTYKLKQQNARIMVSSLMGLGAMTYFMAATMAPEDELGRNSVHADNMKQWNRYARFHIPDEIAESLGMGKNVVFQMPWGFGLGAFMAAGAQIAGATTGRGTMEEALKNIYTDIALDSFLPLPISKMDATDNPVNFLIDSISPSIARPLLQFALNKDGLGRGIYNEPYRRMADAFAGGDRVPEAYKDAARYMFNETGIDVNPNSLYFLSNSYFDGVGRLLETSYGALGLTGEKPRNIKQESLIFGSFFGNKGNVDNREFAEIQSQLMKKQANLNSVKTDPVAYAKYIERNPMDEVLVKSYLKDVNGELKKLQSQAKQIRMAPSDMLSPKERQEMLEPNLLMQRLIKANLVEKYKAYDIKP